ncbi:hypothetical protein HZS_3011 [Henneguya salminicola]|nr:hypothetical protein HZS_3011 [Henneguya salminicola]
MDSTYQEISNLLSRYYNADTPNADQKFSSQIDSCKLCLNFLKITSDIYMHMFALSNTLNRRWHTLSKINKNLIKTELYDMIFQNSYSLTPTISKKLCKIFALICRNEYPEEFPEFFKIIEQVL